ncbi:CPBP family intramembrane glutamic endopeptidase [Candidatus Magnetobacterium casense]|uniref:CPBP family intramembrane metalloprotease n=1 Tax=Candidatus Magnetobacterium casense TaxID=1455061 RepID=A0ABS6S2L4_9BACT|nr:CPBP family intramembrane glutamic endopeptidase [Candidatus Magnetobacterium casensis]MBV6343079.1 CPBP family intramembrane metalloprotease [Candidatus Magnetobacterium casensis]
MTPAIERRRVVVLAVAVEGGLLLLAAVLSGRLHIGLVFGSERPLRDCLVALAWTLPPVAVFVISLSEMAMSLSFMRTMRQFVINHIRAMFINTTFVDVVFICILAGVGEEALFRGIVQVKFGIIWGSVIFGLLHFVSPAYFVFATAMGLYIGWVFTLYNSLFVPILIHFLYDLGAIVYLKYYVKEE